GEECRAGNVGVLLGPGMNIYRISQCGRNFEYFGEDPFLAAGIIGKYVKGLQSTGTVATLKHFVANNTDFFRRISNSTVSERALHEIYFPAFKAGIDSDAKAVMTSYNLLNGEWCGESNYVINGMLRGKLGYKWMVMSDWWSVHDGEKLAKSGQDLEMPNTIALEKAKDLLDQGKVKEADIDRMVKSILRTCFAMKLFDREQEPDYYKKFPEHVEIALQTAREGTILLKNKNNILPIKQDVKNILLTGSYVKELLHGGGAARVDGYDIVTMLQAIKDEFGDRVRFVKDPTVSEIKSADLVLCNIGTEDSEGWDRTFALPAEQEEKVKRCVNNNPNTVVIVTSGSGIRMTDWNDKAAAILYAWYGGQTGNVALAEILSGKTTPSGKLPITIEKDFRDSPGYGYTQGEALYTGWDAGNKGEKERPVYDVEYKEGVFVGYRFYEAKKIEPLYPFGFGLSYATFKYKDIKVSKDKFNENDEIIVSVTISNTSDVEGAEIVQLYVEDVESSVPRPLKELKGFVKVNLKPGKTQQVQITLDKKDFSFWNPETKDWFAEKGEFKIHIGSSSVDIRLTKEIELL
ncbi:MAG: glycoside hydrolase family 3 C-terminal domain-containing protein, partial [Deltaproteobacteria bacterium]|nr:glycoside hydrolase family 3 C-terminal domain-containing protein [Deltaproteobacteria bacterium]